MTTYYKEAFLIQVIFYSLIWLMSEYTGFLLCTIMSVIIGALLLFAYIIELVQKSQVPKSYFRFMLMASLAPLVVLLLFSVLYGGQFDWIRS